MKWKWRLPSVANCLSAYRHAGLQALWLYVALHPEMKRIKTEKSARQVKTQQLISTVSLKITEMYPNNYRERF